MRVFFMQNFLCAQKQLCVFIKLCNLCKFVCKKEKSVRKNLLCYVINSLGTFAQQSFNIFIPNIPNCLNLTIFY